MAGRNTGDIALEDVEYLLILGCVSEIINVGGAKDYADEVESVMRTMPAVDGGYGTR